MDEVWTAAGDNMVERVALALDPEAFAYEQLVPRRSYWQRRRKAARNSAKAALEANHHAELVEALEQIKKYTSDNLAKGRASAALALIGGAQ